jgi:hypothetical protein
MVRKFLSKGKFHEISGSFFIWLDKAYDGFKTALMFCWVMFVFSWLIHKDHDRHSVVNMDTFLEKETIGEVFAFATGIMLILTQCCELRSGSARTRIILPDPDQNFPCGN